MIQNIKFSVARYNEEGHSNLRVFLDYRECPPILSLPRVTYWHLYNRSIIFAKKEFVVQKQYELISLTEGP